MLPHLYQVHYTYTVFCNTENFTVYKYYLSLYNACSVLFMKEIKSVCYKLLLRFLFTFFFLSKLKSLAEFMLNCDWFPVGFFFLLHWLPVTARYKLLVMFEKKSARLDFARKQLLGSAKATQESQDKEMWYSSKTKSVTRSHSNTACYSVTRHKTDGRETHKQQQLWSCGASRVVWWRPCVLNFNCQRFLPKYKKQFLYLKPCEFVLLLKWGGVIPKQLLLLNPWNWNWKWILCGVVQFWPANIVFSHSGENLTNLCLIENNIDSCMMENNLVSFIWPVETENCSRP